MKGFLAITFLSVACTIPGMAAFVPVASADPVSALASSTATRAPASDPVRTHPTAVAEPAAPLTRDPTKPPVQPAPAKVSSPATTTAKKVASTKPATAGGMSVVVNVAGGQAAIDACRGPVLYGGVIIAQHDRCGGTRYYSLGVGSLVTLSGAAVRAGVYRVTAIANNRAGSASYTWPREYMIETCIGGGAVRLWYIEKVSA